MSKLIDIKNVEDGMILAEPVVNNFGQTLLSPGTELLSSHIRILKTWNIISIRVKGDKDEEETYISPALLKIAEENITKRMKWRPRTEIEKNLFRMGIMSTAILLSKSGDR